MITMSLFKKDDEDGAGVDEDLPELGKSDVAEEVKRQREATKDYVIVKLDDDGEPEGRLTWSYGMLSETDDERIENVGVETKQQGRETTVNVKKTRITTERLIAGLRSAPPGYKLTRQGVAEMLHDFGWYMHDLAECIQNFSKIEPVVRRTFRPGRAREESED